MALRSGLVRCGVCQTPFNGIQNLVGRIAPQPEAPVEPPVETPAVEQPATAPIQTPAPAATLAPAVSEPVMAVAEEAAAEAPAEVDTTSEPVLSDSERVLQEAFDKQLASFSLELGDPEPAKADTPQKTEPTLTDAPAEAASAPVTQAPEVVEPVKKKKGHPFLWFIGILILLIALCLQGIYFYSKDIVEAVPDLEEPVETVCETLSCPVEEAEAPVAKPAFTLTESKLTAEKGKTNAFILTAVLTNTGKQNQPLPTLALEVSDKDGKVLARRPVSPQDYAAPADMVTKGLAPAQSTAVSVQFEHSQATAVSNRLVLSDSPKK